MIKNVHLGFFINEYNSDPIYYELAEFKDVIELDRFMDYFLNNNEKIRKLFDQDISEYSIDNIKQFKEVEKISKKKFRGRIAAYYFNELGQLEFIDLPTSKRKPIRDYKILPDLESSFDYLSQVFDEAVKKINARYQNKKETASKGEFVHYICEKLKQVGYEVSEDELYSLVVYYNKQTDENKKTCLDKIKVNLKKYFKEKEKREERAKIDEDLRLERETIEQEKKLDYSEETPKTLQYDVEETKKSDDYDHLFMKHDLDELDKYTNALRKGK